MSDIGASVGVKDGVPCYNNPADQRIVMDLLEKIDISKGGVAGDPGWSRPSDASLKWKACPPILRNAILKFQNVNRSKLSYQPDGHVDPGGATIVLLNSLATGSPVQTLPEVKIAGTKEDIELEIHDSRIEGSGQFAVNRRVRYVNEDTPYSAVLNLIDIELRLGKQITRLDIVAHGYYVGLDDNDYPLFGIMVGREGIHGGFTAKVPLRDGLRMVFPPGAYPSNLSAWSRFKGRIDEIRLYACGAANPIKKPGNLYVEMEMSGYEMCGKLAKISGAYVMGALMIQAYNYKILFGGGVQAPNGLNTRIEPTNWGKWEGPVFVFSPISGRAIAKSTNGADPVYRRGM